MLSALSSSSAAAPPSAPAGALPKDQLRALHARLRATLLNCYAHRRAPYEHFAGLGQAEREALNADLELVRAANARLRHRDRSLRIAAWPVPVLPDVLLAAADLIGLLESATRATSTALHAMELPDA